MTDLAIVIVNYNTAPLLRRCLTSIRRQEGDYRIETCVVDNASRDDSVAMVRTEFPEVHLIANAENAGFSRANNLGLRHFGFGQTPPPAGLPRYALLLNPDTELPPTALATMLAFMDATPDAGAAGPRLLLPDGSLDLACRRSFPSPEVSFYRMVGLSRLFPTHPRFGRYNLTYLNPDELAEVDSVVGAFMLVRAEAIQQAGLMDETYFMYGEDLDWAYSIKQHGWKIYYNPAATVLHVKRASSRRSAKAQVEFYRAMQIFYRKHYAATTPWWLHLLVTSGIQLKWSLARLAVGWRRLRGQMKGEAVL